MSDMQADSSSWPKPAVAWLAVGVLVFAFLFSIADRIIIALLVTPIQEDLQLSDTDMGWMMGPAFALFYAMMGLPIGRSVDNYSRRAIVGTGIFLWSIMTVICGFTRTFWQMFFARVGVAVGEATLSPAAYSLIADSFPKDKLGRALGVYQSGAFLGVAAALMFGGLVIGFAAGADTITLPVVGALKPWQFAFVAVGLPGVLVAACMFLVKEPTRKIAKAAENEISLWQAVLFVFENGRVLFPHYIGFGLLALPMTTLATWIPEYYIRVVGMPPSDTGITLGLIVLFFSPFGVIGGGWLADKWFRQGLKDAALRVAVMAAALLVPLCVLATSITDQFWALVVFAPFVFGSSISMGLAATALQVVTPNRLRGQVGAVWMLFLNIITAFLGPLLVGIITDSYFGDRMRLGDSLIVVNLTGVVLGGLILWNTWKPFRQAAEQQSV